jgi:hypothetical protein
MANSRGIFNRIFGRFAGIGSYEGDTDDEPSVSLPKKEQFVNTQTLATPQNVAKAIQEFDQDFIYDSEIEAFKNGTIKELSPAAAEYAAAKTAILGEPLPVQAISPLYLKYTDPKWIAKYSVNTEETLPQNAGLIPQNQLPKHCPNHALPYPNAFIRSALFGPVKRGRLKRKAWNNTVLWSTANFKMTATGVELCLNDFLVWSAILKLYMDSDFGGYQLMREQDVLRELDRNHRGGKGRSDLTSSILRLSTVALRITDPKSHKPPGDYYHGKLIDLQEGKFKEGTFSIKFDFKIVKLLASVTFFDKQLTHTIMGEEHPDWTFCLALYFKSTKDKKGSVTYLKTETIKQMLRSEEKQERQFHWKLGKCFTSLTQKGVFSSWIRNKEDDQYEVTY